MFVFLSVLLASAASAQTGVASLRGLVKDPSGAVIPQAVITAVHVEAGRNRKHEARANDAGLYVLPSLQPGRYQFTARSEGMRPWSGELVVQTGPRW